MDMSTQQTMPTKDKIIVTLTAAAGVLTKGELAERAKVRELLLPEFMKELIREGKAVLVGESSYALPKFAPRTPPRRPAPPSTAVLRTPGPTSDGKKVCKGCCEEKGISAFRRGHDICLVCERRSAKQPAKQEPGLRVESSPHVEPALPSASPAEESLDDYSPNGGGRWASGHIGVKPKSNGSQPLLEIPHRPGVKGTIEGNLVVMRQGAHEISIDVDDIDQLAEWLMSAEQNIKASAEEAPT